MKTNPFDEIDLKSERCTYLKPYSSCSVDMPFQKGLYKEKSSVEGTVIKRETKEKRMMRMLR